MTEDSIKSTPEITDRPSLEYQPAPPGLSIPEKESSDSPAIDNIPEAVVRARRSISTVWLIPLVAALIGGWLVYKIYSEKGPAITISFKSASGLEVEKTKIKYKDVEIGQVRLIRLNEDLSGVVVTADLDKSMEKFLTENTRFWVVSARVSLGEVSGLSTIFSGAYIALDPGKPGNKSTAFQGLDTPPLVTTDVPGRHFTLLAGKRGSLDIGAPVYYRQIKVGQVVSRNLAEDGETFRIKIFVDAPYDKYVHQNTKFWNMSGVDVALDANGLRINTESVASLLIGGLAFHNPSDGEAGPLAGEDTVFTLYDTFDKANERSYTREFHYVINFSGSVRGLSVGAPVEFRGIKIGQVVDLKLELDKDQQLFRIPVHIVVHPTNFLQLHRKEIIEKGINFEYLVKHGLRAQLQTDNLLTGQLFVALDFFPDEPEAIINKNGPYREIPAIPTPLEAFSGNMKKMLDRVSKLPLEEIGAELRETLGSLNKTVKRTEKLVANLDAHTAPQATATMKQAQDTLNSAQKVLTSDSPLQYDLRRTLKELTDAAQSLNMLVDYLERHPEAVLRGKGKNE